MTTLKAVKATIKRNMVKTGVIASIDARIAKHNLAALSLGYATAQEAFNKMGKPFLTIANA